MPVIPRPLKKASRSINYEMESSEVVIPRWVKSCLTSATPSMEAHALVVCAQFAREGYRLASTLESKFTDQESCFASRTRGKIQDIATLEPSQDMVAPRVQR